MSGSCGRRPILPGLRSADRCEIRTEMHKRNGSELWWCHIHGVEANGPDGPCSGASTPPLRPEDVFEIDLNEFPGGVGVWGATPPAMSWGPYANEAGVHVHARLEPDGPKDIDGSFAVVRVTSGRHVVEIDEASAVAHLISSYVGQANVSLTCPHCGWFHLDRDQFAVSPHRKHLCNRCGRNFWAEELTISNPVAGAQERLGLEPPLLPLPTKASLRLTRADYGAVALWGSNPAIVWTAARPEAVGIHVHALDAGGQVVIDETYGNVEIDGVVLDPELVSLLMVQRALPETADRLRSLSCPRCGAAHADVGAAAVVPRNTFMCSACGQTFQSPGRRKVACNPLLAVFKWSETSAKGRCNR